MSLPPFKGAYNGRLFCCATALFRCVGLLFRFVYVLRGSLTTVPFHSLRGSPLGAFGEGVWASFLVEWILSGRAFPLMLFCVLCDFAMRRDFFLHPPFVFFGPVLMGALYQSVLDRCL